MTTAVRPLPTAAPAPGASVHFGPGTRGRGRFGLLLLAHWLVLGAAWIAVCADYRVPQSASWSDLGLLALALGLPVAFVVGVSRSVRRVVRHLDALL